MHLFIVLRAEISTKNSFLDLFNSSLDRAQGMFLQFSKFASSVLKAMLEICFDHARSMFWACSSYVSKCSRYVLTMLGVYLDRAQLYSTVHDRAWLCVTVLEVYFEIVLDPNRCLHSFFCGLALRCAQRWMSKFKVSSSTRFWIQIFRASKKKQKLILKIIRRISGFSRNFFLQGRLFPQSNLKRLSCKVLQYALTFILYNTTGCSETKRLLKRLSFLTELTWTHGNLSRFRRDVEVLLR